MPGLKYVTADIEPGRADLAIDLTAMDLPDSSFEAVICSHVLEHVRDDRQALRELYRVLTPGGWALIMIPIDEAREATYEDAAIVAPEDRVRAFWQDDHLRLYGRDVAERLAEPGFHVDVVRVGDEFDAATCSKYGLLAGHQIFICSKT